MDSFLQVDASEDSSQRKIARKAIVLSSTRYQQSLHSFVAGAQDADEFEARLGLVQDDLEEIVKNACEEVGYQDADGIIASISLTARQHFADSGNSQDEDQDNQDDTVSPGASQPPAQAEESQEVPEDDETQTTSATKMAEGTPEPKMDKRKWTPKNLGELPKDKADGPHPTEQQDVTDRTRSENTTEHPLKNIGEGVTERVDVTQDHAVIRAPHTKTFPKGNQANPVTSSQNPIRDILNRESGFVPQPEVDRIISLHNSQ